MFDLHRERILTSSEFGNLQISPEEEGSNHSFLFDLMLDIGQQLLRNVVQQLRASLEQLSGLLSQAPQVSQRSALKAETQVYALLEELLEQPVLDPQASIFEQDGGSLRAVLLCARLQARWGTEIPPQLVFLHPQLADLVRVLKTYAGMRAY